MRASSSSGRPALPGLRAVGACIGPAGGSHCPGASHGRTTTHGVGQLDAHMRGAVGIPQAVDQGEVNDLIPAGPPQLIALHAQLPLIG